MYKEVEFFVFSEGFGEYEEAAWLLTKAADEDFVPPLSTRMSTTQKNLNPGASEDVEGPVEYFAELKKQHNLLAVEDNRLLGFMSFRPDHELGCYVSTVIVDASIRNQGIAKQLYEKLIATAVRPIATRTWSQNHAHIHILEELGFINFDTIPNDRGVGIDTVYFKRDL